MCYKLIDQADIEEYVCNKLLELNFNISNKGFRYWSFAIKYFVRHYDIAYKIQMEELYCCIAELNDTTRVRVERNMRTELLRNKKELEKRYKSKRLTTKTLLFLIGSEVYNEWKKKY